VEYSERWNAKGIDKVCSRTGSQRGQCVRARPVCGERFGQIAGW
jgi:hypothetical protein